MYGDGYQNEYSTLGKDYVPFQNKRVNPLVGEPEIRTELDQNVRIPTEIVVPYNQIAEINEDYLISVDAWENWRGESLAFDGMVVWTMSLAMLFPAYMAMRMYMDQEYFHAFFFIVSIFAIFKFFILKVFKLFYKVEFFGKSYYPIIFNRKLKKIYFLNPSNHQWYAEDWQEMRFAIEYYNKSFDLRGNIIKEDKVEQCFSFPFIVQFQPEFLLLHWEFYRRYMTDELLAELTPYIHHRYPAFGRKETFKEIKQRVKLSAQTDYDNLGNIVIRSTIFMRYTGLIYFTYIPRYISAKTSTVPEIPDWIKQELGREI